MSTSTQIVSPLIPPAVLPGEIVGLVLQDVGGVASVAGTAVTFGQVFAAGAVQAGQQLYASVDGQTVAVQMDAKTFNADGSVADAVLSLNAPAIAAGTSDGVMLSAGPALAQPAPAIDLASALQNYSLTVDLTIHNADGTTTPTHIDAVAAMETALANGTASYWEQGPVATQARVTVPVSGSMQMQFDITANANGTFSTDVQFLNQEAWVVNWQGQIENGTKAQAVGGTVTYDETITQNGAVVSRQSNIKQYQYQNWHTIVTTQPSINQINVQHDVAYLEATGAVQNYDLSTGVQASVVASEAAQMAAGPSATASGINAPFGAPLAANGVDPGMGGTGGRPDIGPTTGYNAAWLITQNATAGAYAAAQANAAGAVPWNLENGASGTPLTTAVDPGLWSDGRGSSKPLQGIGQAGGWEVDMAHQPALSYDTGLLTGSRYAMDETENQGAFAVISSWPAAQERNVDGYDDIVVYNNQVRGAAWDLRDVINAAQLAPAGSAEKAYFTQVETDNFTFLISQEASLTAQQGQAHGYIEGGWGNTGGIAPWQQDYLYSSIAQAALQGNGQARQIMGWMDNFIVGRFLAGSQGFNPQDGVAYDLTAYNPSAETQSGNPMTASYDQTWAGIEAATTAAGGSNGINPGATNWAQSQGDYGDLALVSLADTISVFNTPGSTQAAQAFQAYGWLVSAGDPYINLGDLTSLNDVQFDIAPRLADGTLLTRADLLIGTDKAGTTNTLSLGPTTDQLIHAGAGNDVLEGGSGIDILFAGSGTDQLIGGANNDFLYGGTGSATFSAGAGINYMQAGSGADTFILNAGDTATDTINGFKIGTDQLDITAANGTPVSAADIQTLITTATTDATGNAVLHLSPNHAVTLVGISPATLTGGMFIAGSGTLPGDVTGADVLQLAVSEDAWQGDAKFIVTVDGKQVGGTEIVNGALQNAGQTDTITLDGVFGAGPHDVGVSFINDAWGGSAAEDRNLYVDTINYNGVAYAQDNAALDTNSTVNFTVGALPQVPGGPMTGPVIGSGPDTLQLLMSEDAWQGDAEFTVSVDGQQVGGVQTVAGALRSQGQAEVFTLNGSFGNGPHDIDVSFINDAYGGSPTKDRNLYVKNITYDGQSYGNDTASLTSNGTASFSAGATAPESGAPLTGATIGSGPDTLTLGVSEDAWQGDAQFIVKVNGQQIGGVQTVDGGASHASGAVENFTVNGSFGAGPNNVSVSFINDAYGGSSSMDRNLYVDGMSYDGTSYTGNTATLLSNGSASFTVGAAASDPAPTPAPASNVLTVGANGEYQTLAAAAAAAQSGDTIEIAAGTYTNDFASLNGNITVEGVGGMVNEVATEAPPDGKAILDVSGDVTVNNMSFSGAAVSDGNGAGIRYESGNLTLNNDSFFNNQDGLLGGADSGGTITINNSEFANNGTGDGYTHNLYVGSIAGLTVNNSLFTGANAGHEIKSRAASTTVENSRIEDGPGGTASYDIDTPNGGAVTISNNVIEKAATASNPIMISDGEEGGLYANSSLTVSGNTLINNLNSPSSMGIMNATSATASVSGNQIYGLSSGQIVSGAANLGSNTMLGSAPSLDLSPPFSSALTAADVTSQPGTVAGALATTTTTSPASTATTGSLGLSTQTQTTAASSMLHAA